MDEPVHVIGASGRSGAALARALAARGTPVVPVVRNAARWTALPVAPRVADLGEPGALAAALRDATRIASGAHARHTAAIIAAAPPDARLVLLGSTRKFTRWPDEHARGVLAGEAAFLASGRRGVMLHPTMIYGAQGEDNVRRLARLLRLLPVVPLPAGGRSLVQPIYQDDVTRAVMAALDCAWDGPRSLVIAGPEPMPYAAFVAAIAAAIGRVPPRVVPLPLWLLIAAGWPARLAPGLPTIRAAELRRLTEDKAFDASEAVALLGLSPTPLREGLASSLAA